MLKKRKNLEKKSDYLESFFFLFYLSAFHLLKFFFYLLSYLVQNGDEINNIVPGDLSYRQHVSSVRDLINTVEHGTEFKFWTRLCISLTAKTFGKYMNPTILPPGPFCLGCIIHRLHLLRGKTPTLRVSWKYDTKQFDGEIPVMLDFWGMQSTPLLPSPQGPLCPGVVAPDRAQYMGWIELTAYLCYT